MIDVLQQKWKDDKAKEEAIRANEKKHNDKFLDIMTQQSKSLDNAVDILRKILKRCSNWSIYY